MNKQNLIRFACIALSGASIVPAMSAASSSAANGMSTAAEPPVAAVRASEWINADVISTDGIRVGEAVDYVLQFGGSPQLRYVVIKSGAGFGRHVEERAIPADAITLVDKQLHVSLTGPAYTQLPVVSARLRSFLSSSENQATMANLCGTPVDHASLNGTFTLYSDLKYHEAIVGDNNADLGLFSDLWIDFNANEAPFVEMVPTVVTWDGNRDRTDTGLHYELPTTEFTGVGRENIQFSVAEAELDHLPMIDQVSSYVAAAGEELEKAQVKAMP